MRGVVDKEKMMILDVTGPAHTMDREFARIFAVYCRDDSLSQTIIFSGVLPVSWESWELRQSL
jgi:hypothetical protein